MIGTDIQEFPTVLQQGVGDTKKILLVVSLNHDQAQESIAHIGVAASIVPYTHQLKRILSREPHPCPHQSMPAQEPWHLLEQSGSGRDHLREHTLLDLS